LKRYDNYLSSGQPTPLTASAASASPNQYPGLNSYISPYLMTDIMEEIANVITDAGLSLDGTDRTQLSAAVTLLAAGGATANIQSGNFTASFGTTYLVKIGGGDVTATLPLAPAAGDDGKQIIFRVSDKDLNGNKLTLARNGENIMGLAEDMDIEESDGVNVSVVATWDNTGNEWLVTIG